MKVAGADVWKGQWVVVVLDDGAFERAFVAPTIDAVLGDAADAVVVGVDMPIGLPGPGQRRPADVEARKHVGPRWQSVFMTPCVNLLQAASLGEANKLAAAEGWEGISAQAYALGKLILQVQPAAARDPRVFEVHPEVSFACASGDRALQWPKATWNGVALRRRILRDNGIVIGDDIGSAGIAGVADVLDACIAAWSAGRIASAKGQSFPGGAERVGAIWR